MKESTGDENPCHDHLPKTWSSAGIHRSSGEVYVVEKRRVGRKRELPRTGDRLLLEPFFIFI